MGSITNGYSGVTLKILQYCPNHLSLAAHALQKPKQYPPVIANNHKNDALVVYREDSCLTKTCLTFFKLASFASAFQTRQT